MNVGLKKENSTMYFKASGKEFIITSATYWKNKNNSISTQENAVTQVGDSNYGELERSKHSQVANAGSLHNFVTRNRLIGPILLN